MWIEEIDIDFTKGIDPECVDEFIHIWKEDINLDKLNGEYKLNIIRYANAYLKYFGSAWFVVDVDFVENGFKWNMRNKFK